MKNNTAIAVSAGLVLAVAGVSGATYVTAAQRPPGEVPPSTEIIVEFVDEQGNVVPIEATVVTSDEKSTTAASASDSDEEEYRDDDRYENDDRHEDDHGYEDDDGYDEDEESDDD